MAVTALEVRKKVVEACLGSEPYMHGVWMIEGKTDVHLYLQENPEDGFVIGHNLNHSNQEFTPLALSLTKDNKFTLQLNVDGKPKNFEVPEKAVRQGLLNFLNSIKATVKDAI